MKLEFTYGDGLLAVDIPEGKSVDTFSPRKSKNPIGCDQFHEMSKETLAAFADQDDPLIVVNDAYRNTPTPQVLECIDHNQPGLIDRSEFLVATGTHAAPTSDQLDIIFGSYRDRVLDRLNIHDCRNPECMTDVGLDKFAEPVFVNTQFMHAQRPLLISSVEPHYFAGFSGGRKSIFPGLADLKTVERNHNLANSMAAQPLKLDGNPVADHLMNLASIANMQKMLGIQLVVDSTGEVASVSCGALHDSFMAATERAFNIFANKVEQPYDIVLCELTAPLDRNLYQIQKALENCQGGVADGGSLVLISKCTEGIGTRAFYDLAKEWNRERNRPRKGQLKFGSHKLTRVVNHTKRIHVHVVSDLDAADVRQVFYEPLDNLNEFLFIAWNNSAAARVAAVFDAGNTVLTI